MADTGDSSSKLTEEERKERQRAYNRDYYQKNRAKLLDDMRAYREANIEKLREHDRKRHKMTRGAGSEYNKARYQRKDKVKAKEDLAHWKAENPDKVRAMDLRRIEKDRERYRNDPEFLEKRRKASRECAQRRRERDPEFVTAQRAATKRWVKDNPDWSRAYGKKKRERLKDCPQAKIMASVRARIGRYLRGQTKSHATAVLLGAPVQFVKEYIEAQFRDGMSWDNYGRGWGNAKQWHLDHIRPLASFDLSNADELAAACHYTNLQPLWSVDNLRKGAKR